MKRKLIVVLAGFIALAAMNVTAEEAPKELVDWVESVLLDYSSDTTILRAVETENAKGKTLSQIQDVDGQWKGTPGIASFMDPILNSSAADYLRTIQDEYKFLAEIFVMDNLGANVAMTDKTSDYWQGDEAKFKNSFNDGAGSTFIDEVEFDESAQCYMVQVSIPVMKGGKAVGAITFGIDLDAFEQM